MKTKFGYAFFLVVLFGTCGTAGAQTTSSAVTDQNPLPTLVITVLVGVLSALATQWIRDRSERVKAERDRRATDDEIVRNYLAPLSDTCGKVVWRLSEVFVAGRHQWLKSETLPLDFNEYKRFSTLYRIAALLGWLRAIDLELVSLPRTHEDATSPTSLAGVLAALKPIRSALADGIEVEVQRLNVLCKLWGLEMSNTPREKLGALATEVEVELYRLAPDLRDDPDHLLQSTEEQKLRVCKGLGGLIAKGLGIPLPSDSVITNSLPVAVVAVAYREAWLYRDWQDAIGDAVLELDGDSIRRYKIMGLPAFSELLERPSPWFEKLKKIVHDVDVETSSPNDARVSQLKRLGVVTAQLLEAIAARESGLIDANTLATAKRLIN